MIIPRPAAARGHARHGWLESWHSFSFADYFDPAHMGFGALRVINEDIVAPGTGFPMHGHRDMEIITWILDGALEHRDSMGHGEVIRPGEVQRMSAGTGVRHSEANPLADAATHLLQIWILPSRAGFEPSYEQTAYPDSELRNRLRLVASPDAEAGSVRIHQDARLFVARLDAGARVSHAFAPGRLGWLQVARGGLLANGAPFQAGDGAGLREERVIELVAGDGGAEVLLFDLPPAAPRQ